MVPVSIKNAAEVTGCRVTSSH